MSQQKFDCILSNNWLAGLESATLCLTSPTGRAVTLHKTNYQHIYKDLTSDEREVVLYLSCLHSGLVHLTREQMQLFANMEKRVGLKKIKLDAKKHNAQKQAIVRANCKHPRMREKNHGTWIGWYCPDCKQGGSREVRFINSQNKRK